MPFYDAPTRRMLKEAARQTLLRLDGKEFRGTVEVGDLRWDVYVHPLRPGAWRDLSRRQGKIISDAVTIALRLDHARREVIVGALLPGDVAVAEIHAFLHEADA